MENEDHREIEGYLKNEDTPKHDRDLKKKKTWKT